MADLVERLRSWKQVRTTPYPIGYYLDAGIKAADEIERLSAEVADHKAAFNKLNEMLAESLEDRDRLRAEIAALKRALGTDWDGKSTLRMLTAERDALKKDAERYRWLRQYTLKADETTFTFMPSVSDATPELFDIAIDAALGGED